LAGSTVAEVFGAASDAAAAVAGRLTARAAARRNDRLVFMVDLQWLPSGISCSPIMPINKY
jgi:hypothetical protein